MYTDLTRLVDMAPPGAQLLASGRFDVDMGDDEELSPDDLQNEIIKQWVESMKQDPQMMEYVKEEPPLEDMRDWLITQVDRFYADHELHLLSRALRLPNMSLKECNPLEFQSATFPGQEKDSIYTIGMRIMSAPEDLQKRQIAKPIAMAIGEHEVAFAIEGNNYTIRNQSALPARGKSIITSLLTTSMTGATILIEYDKCFRGSFSELEMKFLTAAAGMSCDICVNCLSPMEEAVFYSIKDGIKAALIELPGCMNLQCFTPLVTLHEHSDGIRYKYVFRHQYHMKFWEEVKGFIHEHSPGYTMSIVRYNMLHEQSPAFHLIVPEKIALECALLIARICSDSPDFEIDIGNKDTKYGTPPSIAAGSTALIFNVSPGHSLCERDYVSDPWVEERLKDFSGFKACLHIKLEHSEFDTKLPPGDFIKLVVIIDISTLPREEILRAVELLDDHPSSFSKRLPDIIYGKTLYKLLILSKRKMKTLKNTEKSQSTDQSSAEIAALEARAEQVGLELIRSEEHRKTKKGRKKKKSANVSSSDESRCSTPQVQYPFTISSSFLNNIIENDGVEMFVNTCRSGGYISTDLMTTRSRMGERWITFLKLKNCATFRNISSIASMTMGNKFKARSLVLWKSHRTRVTAKKGTEACIRFFTVQKKLQKAFFKLKERRDEIVAETYVIALLKSKLFWMAFNTWHKNMLNRIRIPPWNKKHVTRIELKDADGSTTYLVMPSVYVPEGLKEMIDKGDPYKTFQFVFLQRKSSS